MYRLIMQNNFINQNHKKTHLIKVSVQNTIAPNKITNKVEN
jgi:hypothetical protein